MYSTSSSQKKKREMLWRYCCAMTMMAMMPLCCRAGVGAIVPPDLFEQFLPARNNAQDPSGNLCAPGFYNWDAFVAAASVFPAFGTTGTLATQKREMAAFFAHVSHETGRGCHARQVSRAAGDNYYGRGPLQLTGLSNYRDAGHDLNFDGVNHPDIVATNSKISFETAIWFWMRRSGPNSPTCHTTVVNEQGFGPTTRTINGAVECGGLNRDQQDDRINLYQSFCNKFGITCNKNLYC